MEGRWVTVAVADSRGVAAAYAGAAFRHARSDDGYHADCVRIVTEQQLEMLAGMPGLRADPRVNGSILRINRDTRFSNDKRPYKTHLDLWLWEGDGPSRGCSGFFLRLEADRVGYGAGMHHFEKGMLAGYRAAVDDA